MGKVGGPGSVTSTPRSYRQSPSEGNRMTATDEGKGSGRTRPLNTLRPGDGDPRHGKPSTYTNHKCRCAPCRGAWADYCRELRERRAAQAGR